MMASLVLLAAANDWEPVDLSNADNIDEIVSVFRHGSRFVLQKVSQRIKLNDNTFTASLHNVEKFTGRTYVSYKYNATLRNNDNVVVRTWFTVRLNRSGSKLITQWRYVVNYNTQPKPVEPEPWVPIDPSEYDTVLLNNLIVESVRTIIKGDAKIPRTTYKLTSLNSVEKQVVSSTVNNYKFDTAFKSLDEVHTLTVNFVSQFDSEGESKVLSYSWKLNSKTN